MLSLAAHHTDPALIHTLAGHLDAIETAEAGDTTAWEMYLQTAVFGTDAPGMLSLVLCARLLVQMRPGNADTPLGELAGPLADYCTTACAASPDFTTHARDVILTVLADGRASPGYDAALAEPDGAAHLTITALCVVAALCALQQVADQATDNPDATRGDALRRCILTPGPKLTGIYTIGSLPTTTP